jgi:hypothetical protein
LHAANDPLSPDPLAQMRADWVVCRPWLRAAEGWPEEDLAAAGQAIRAASVAKDAELLACWASWLAVKAAEARDAAARCRAAEKRIMLIKKRKDMEQTSNPLRGDRLWQRGQENKA